MPATTRQYKKSFLRSLIIPVCSLAALGYFGFHAIVGEYGITGREHIDGEVANLQQELKKVSGERKALEKRVSLLRPESLNADMIDERARESLNMANSNELVILRPGHSY